MDIGYLRATTSMEDLREGLTALELAGCDRIVVETSDHQSAHPRALRSVVKRLSKGDALVVLNLEAVADEIRSLIGVVGDLCERDVRFRSIAEGFDTAGKSGKVLRRTLIQLHALHMRSSSCAKDAAVRKYLSRKDVATVRSLMMDEVAKRHDESPLPKTSRPRGGQVPPTQRSSTLGRRPRSASRSARSRVLSELA